MTKEEMSKLGIPKPLKDKMIKAAEERHVYKVEEVLSMCGELETHGVRPVADDEVRAQFKVESGKLEPAKIMNKKFKQMSQDLTLESLNKELNEKTVVAFLDETERLQVFSDVLGKKDLM